MSELSELEATLVGVSGDHYVASELSIRGYLASVTLRNSCGIDIIASNSDASRSVSIQVKTSKQGKPRWVLTKKSEEYWAEGHFYVFVVLGSVGSRPDFHIVPSETVARYIANMHRKYLASPGRGGKLRKDGNMRVFEDAEGEYKEAWHLLGL